ncbi:MAG: SPFH domain-containing protein [Planctomycetota bacterium]|nr:SPFH domain-containing protein [Planctomycetota bacterium]
MTEQKRAKNVALVGAVVHVAFLGLVVGISHLTEATSTVPLVVFLGGGLPLWLMIAVRFYCRQLAKQEEHELAELAASQVRTTTIFEGGSDIEGRPAARRLAAFDRWGTPIFTVLWAAYHLVLGLIVLGWLGKQPLVEPKNGQQAAMFVLLAGFAGFLLSRYATGMSARATWRTLRPGGSYLLMSALLLGGQTVSFVLAGWEQLRLPDLLVSYAAVLVQLVLAAELIVNLLLDLYRPRVPGQEDHLSYDSRLLALLAEPQRVGYSIAETLNYQFGFEVSKTWFYRLVATAFGPLLLAGGVALVGMSALVYVPAGHEAVVMRWGQVDKARATLGPGLRTKLPWPFETVRLFDVAGVTEVLLGVRAAGEKNLDGEPPPDAEEPLQAGQHRVKLWQKSHGVDGRQERDFLVPLRRRRTGAKESQGTEPVTMAVAKIVVSVRYRIKDVYQFGFETVDGHALLESLANREVLRFCSTTPFFDDQINDRQGVGGLDATADELRRRIQRAVDARALGAEIVGVGFPAIHPPESTAQSYEAVLGAESKAQAALHEARGRWRSARPTCWGNCPRARTPGRSRPSSPNSWPWWIRTS